ncbi:hypothetical protein MUO32_10070 [Shinella sp. CPCC 101442]|nr:hypothetical protein [Shinella sp. CPCC 101442]MCR6499377.1 hypothetical protein [Shinella sp. CPCC 101442]
MLASTALARAHNGTVHVTIEWTNTDPFAHTATVKGGWEVTIPPGQKATHVVTADDTVEYYCRFHPNMKGHIRVVG